MQVIDDLAQTHFDFRTALTFGAYDGVHRGHQRVIERVRERAEAMGVPSVVLSFYPHPRTFLDPANAPPRLTPREKKIALIEALGIDILLLVKLEPWLSQMAPRTFIEQVTVHRLGARHIVVGYDSEFGHRRQGNAALLRRLGQTLGIGVDVVPPQRVGDEVISSTRIRDAIRAGDLARAGAMLGRRHSVMGSVVKGDRLGRALGFPTANVQVEDQVLPPTGVYAVYVHWRGVPYPAVLNVGWRPTFDGHRLQIEAHLLDFTGDLYGETLEVEFVERIRDERRFEEAERLVDQIRQDIAVARGMLEALRASASE